jgi:hypothetical protein
VRHLHGAQHEEAQHALHHHGGVTLDVFQVELDDVGQERESLDLGPHKIDEYFFVEGVGLSLLETGLQGNSLHDERYEVADVLVDTLFVQLVHQDDDYWELLQYFQRENSFGDQIVLKKQIEACSVATVNNKPLSKFRLCYASQSGC